MTVDFTNEVRTQYTCPATGNIILGLTLDWEGRHYFASISTQPDFWEELQNVNRKEELYQLLREEIQLRIEEDVIHPAPRRLRARWTYEAQQDLRAMHNFNAEAALTDILATELEHNCTHWDEVQQNQKVNWKKEGF